MKSIHDQRYRQLIERLISQRESSGTTQTDLAKLLKKPQSYVAKVENYDRRLDIVEIADWLKALRKKPVLFMDGIDWWQ